MPSSFIRNHQHLNLGYFRLQDLEAKVISLQGELGDLKLEKSRLQEAHRNQLEEIQRLHGVEAEKASVLAELQEASFNLIFNLILL